MTDRDELVAAYWRHHALVTGDRSQRLEAADSAWAWDAVSDAVDEQDPDVLGLLDALLAAPGADPAYVGAGPVEDLLSHGTQRWESPVADRCRTSALWADAVRGVWLSDQARQRLPLLQPWLATTRQRPDDRR